MRCAVRVGAHDLCVGVWARWQKDGAGRWEEVRTPRALLVPIRSASGTLHSLHAIYAERIEDRDKDFPPRGRKAGCFHLLGEVWQTRRYASPKAWRPQPRFTRRPAGRLPWPSMRATLKPWRASYARFMRTRC